MGNPKSEIVTSVSTCDLGQNGRKVKREWTEMDGKRKQTSEWIRFFFFFFLPSLILYGQNVASLSSQDCISSDMINMKYARRRLTSQRGRDENVGAIFFDDGVDELLRGRSAAQQADAALELGHERHGVPDQVPPLDRCIPHLPTCKFPATQQKNDGISK